MIRKEKTGKILELWLHQGLRGMKCDCAILLQRRSESFGEPLGPYKNLGIVPFRKSRLIPTAGAALVPMTQSV